MNVKLIRMHSGEDVIADLINNDSEQLEVSNPIVLVPGRDGTVGFAPWSPVIHPDVKSIRIKAGYVVYVTEPNDDVVNNYNQIFSPLTLPQQQKGLIL
jgi:hypothetical protein